MRFSALATNKFTLTTLNNLFKQKYGPLVQDFIDPETLKKRLQKEKNVKKINKLLKIKDEN